MKLAKLGPNNERPMFRRLGIIGGSYKYQSLPQEVLLQPPTTFAFHPASQSITYVHHVSYTGYAPLIHRSDQLATN